MGNQGSPKKTPASEEIDLGQLFQLLNRGFQRLFRVFLTFYSYLKRNLIILGVLVVVGVGLAIGINQIVSKKIKIEVIVKPNFESKNYLYDVVNEIQANIKAKDSLFFKDLGINISNWSGLEVTIDPLGKRAENLEDEMQYLELLQNFENVGVISDVVRAEILNRSSLNHRITFYYKDASLGPEFAAKVMAYINSNEYFQGLINVYRQNAESRIKENTELIKQIDLLIATYSDKMAQEPIPSAEGRIVLDNEEKINITGLFDLKNKLIQDSERKKLELEERTEGVSVLNFGKSQQVQKSFFGKKVVFIPLVLVSLFFIFSIIRYLNRKSAEL